jgi:hypothetical protein
MESSPATVLRKPLRWDEIPLPPGYPADALDPRRKVAMRDEHEERKAKKLAERTLLARKCTEGTPERPASEWRKQVLALCAVDPVFWIEMFGWTYDDRVGTDEPMVLYDFQRTKIVDPYLSMIATQGRTRWTQCTTKSRGVGYTWVELFLRAWRFSFAENWSVMVGGVSKDLVDDPTHESLFGKLRYIFSKLPKWMRDELYGPLFDRDTYNHRFLLKNPFKPKNIIVGGFFSGMFARSHRYSEIWGDEVAHAEAMKDADRSLKQSTNRFSGGSTPLGKATFHYQLMTNDMAVVRIWLHWSEHPELDADWYNDQRQHMSDEDIASELDCSFEGSAGGRVLKEVSVATHFSAVAEDGTDLAEYQPGLPLQAIIDPGIMDDLAVTWGQWDERGRGVLRGRVVDFVQTRDKAIDWIVPFLTGFVPEQTYDMKPWPHGYNAVELEIIKRHAEWRAPAEIFGDAYGKTRSMATGYSAYDVLSYYGLDVCPVEIEDDIRALVHLRMVLRHVRFARRLVNQRNGNQETCPTMAEVVTQWRYPRRKLGDYREIKAPVKDRFDNGGDTLKMWAATIALPDPEVEPLGSGRVHTERGSDLLGGRARWRFKR